MKMGYTKIVDKTAEDQKLSKAHVRVIMKWFFRGLKMIIRRRLSFKDLDMFHLYRVDRRPGRKLKPWK